MTTKGQPIPLFLQQSCVSRSRTGVADAAQSPLERLQINVITIIFQAYIYAAPANTRGGSLEPGDIDDYDGARPTRPSASAPP